MLSISGFGREGEDAEPARPTRPSSTPKPALIGRQADSPATRPPTSRSRSPTRGLAGLHGTIAILAALRLRDRTGTGQHIDLSMLEAMLATDDYTHYSIDEHPVRPARGEVWPAPGGPILISADRGTCGARLKTCFGVADPDPDAPLEERGRGSARRPPGHERSSAPTPGWPGRTSSGRCRASADGTRGGHRRRPVRGRMPTGSATPHSGRGVPEPGEHTDASSATGPSDAD